MRKLTSANQLAYSPSLLPQIKKLVELEFKSGFKDKKDFGLYRSLSTALKGIASNDYFQVKELLQCLFLQLSFKRY